ncbi:MAG: hypothetical protein QCI38_04520 [Candidatus Thermoplasmatota archaeon]|nr:hypothetical protein [Candidatus Thermoplasmatota archaeon]
MKFVKISDGEMKAIRQLYENVMSYASHGLFFREGCVIGESVGRIANERPDEFFKIAAEILKGRGWVESIEFHYRTAVVHGSIELFEGDAPSCHRLRGIIKKIYEIKNSKTFDCKETECQSSGGEKCSFVLEEGLV